MLTNTLSYLQNKLSLKSILLAFVAAIFLSACGVKGDLYQTPDSVEKTAESSDNEQQDKANGELQEQPVSQSSTNSETEQQ